MTNLRLTPSTPGRPLSNGVTRSPVSAQLKSKKDLGPASGCSGGPVAFK